MRLLLDAMYPPVIAEQLRGRGHDVVAVTERAELGWSPDAAVFAVAQQERRAFAPENVADCISLANEADQRHLPHTGLVLIGPDRYPRGARRTLGRRATEPF